MSVEVFFDDFYNGARSTEVFFYDISTVHGPLLVSSLTFLTVHCLQKFSLITFLEVQGPKRFSPPFASFLPCELPNGQPTEFGYFPPQLEWVWRKLQNTIIKIDRLGQDLFINLALVGFKNHPHVVQNLALFGFTKSSPRGTELGFGWL